MTPAEAREGAIRSLRHDARSALDALDPARIVAAVLDGDAQVLTVWRGRQRERMRAPPAATAQEAPDEVLARKRGELVEVPAGDVQRDDACVLAPHFGY